MVRAARTRRRLWTTASRPVLVSALALSLALALAACTPGSGVTATATLPGAGDSYYPELGNAGYAADHYGLALDIDPARGSLSGTATIDAHATADLPRFSLDLVGLDVHEVTVDGQVAAPSRQGDKLIVVPAHPVSSGAHFTVAVMYSGTPQPIADPSGNRTGADKVGWHHDGDEVYVASEVSGARTWYPVNDTPRNKATYSFALTVPTGYTAVANGTLRGSTPRGSGTTFTWESVAPMASYLATVDVGRFDAIAEIGPQGLPVTVYAPADLAASARARFAQLPDMIAYFESILGPYPFDTAGAVVVSSGFRWSLETQTRPVYGSQVLSMNQETAAEGISHELAHQWFGDSVTLSSWSDIWLNEGFATYLSWLWLEHVGQRDFLTGLMTTQYGYELNAPDYATLLNHADLPADQILPILRRLFEPDGHPVPDAQILAAMGLSSASGLTSAKALGLLGVKPGSADATGYLEDARSSAPVSPPASDLFTGGVYNRGAMALQALRVHVGDGAFFRILSTYAAAHRYGNATTDDFIHAAESVTGSDLASFFQTWLRDPAAPPMPALLPSQ
ncbi:M1 family metallopeptidase [Sinomonas sp. G460-2]|uniref:M1 family metallopeptidase n=1 Tax=Sinomonas sp. G460-2 TaxID=3393464 RepID=UPI0039EE301D